MICKTCGRSIWRSCPHCAAAKELLRAERGYLRTWSAGAIELRLRDFKGSTHLELFSDRWRSYCGKPLFTFEGVVCPPASRRRVKQFPAHVCADCRKIFNELAEKAGVEGRHAL